MEANKLSTAFVVSCLLMLAGFSIFVVGMVSPTWRIGADCVHGLWLVCESDVCKYNFVGVIHYLTIVQCGVAISLLLLSTSVICVLLEAVMRAANCGTRHVVRARRVVTVAASLGQIMAGASLGLYGYKTVMARNRLPVLSSGFALTGVGIILSLLGNILQAMGSPATWAEDIFCSTSKRRYKENLSVVLNGLDTESPSPERARGRRKDKHLHKKADSKKIDLITCFNKTKKGYTYTSVSSTVSSSLGENYRHYEEISFDEMPPPPQDMLIFTPLADTSANFCYQPLENAKNPRYFAQNNTEEENNGFQRIQPAPVPYLEFKNLSENSRTFQRDIPDSFHEFHLRQSEASSSLREHLASQQTKQQRSIIKAAQQDLPPFTTSQSSQRFGLSTDPKLGAPKPTPAARYQSLPVNGSFRRSVDKY